MNQPIEKMDYADDLDRASAESQVLVDHSVTAIRAAATAKTGFLPKANPNGECVDCEDPVEEGRRKLGLARCLHCATLYDRKNGGRR